MATPPIKHQAVIEGEGIYLALKDAQKHIISLSPNQQTFMGSDILKQIGKKHKELQERVQATFEGEAKAILRISDEDLGLLVSRLAESAEILESIEQGTVIAAAISDIENKVITLEQKPDEIWKLLERLDQLKGFPLNEGARTAINGLELALQIKAAKSTSPASESHSPPPQPSSPQRQPIPQPDKELPSSPPPLPSFPETLPPVPRPIQRQAKRTEDVAERTLRPRPPSPKTPPLRSPDLRQPHTQKSAAPQLSRELEEKESKIVSEHEINLAYLSYQNDQLPPEQSPARLFDHVLDLYNEISSSRCFRFQDKYDSLLTDAKSLLLKIIEKQKDLETRLLQTQQAQLASPALIELQDNLQQILETSDPDLFPAFKVLIDQCWDELNEEEKATIESALREALKGVFDVTLKSSPFSEWSGSWEEKLKVVEKLLTPSPSAPAPTAPKISQQMLERFEELLSQRLTPIDDASSSPDRFVIESPTDEFSFEEPYDSSQSGQPFGGIFSELIIEAFPKFMEIGSLLKKPNSLEDALKVLDDLEEKALTSTFKISGQNPKPIVSRLYYHLHAIHKNESPERLIADPDYGRQAFRGDYRAENRERLRAITRTISEVTLETLEDMINFEQTGTEGMENLLALMNIALDEADKVDGHTNVAGMLYSTFDQLHAAARSEDPALDDPAASKYKGDFGKRAFNQTGPGIDPSLKLKAIELVREKMKAAWKLQ